MLLNEARRAVGSMLDMVGVKNINALQQAALQSRLHIPLIFSLDVIHGYKTMFPIAARPRRPRWDPALIASDEAVSASEATADGIKWTFNPMVDISRDPRWGRVEQGAGEDPFLGSAIAAAKVRGYQGNDFSAPNKMAATVKHFAAYGAPVAGREYNTVDMSTQQLFNDYLPPYKAAVDAGAATVMSSFNSLNGVPNTANPYLLQTILRQEWGFGGTVVSDYQAVQELRTSATPPTRRRPPALALNAGVDIEMAVTIPSKYSTYHNSGPQLLASGKIKMCQLNAAVRRVLTLKYLAGMFAHPYTDPNRVKTAELTPANLAPPARSADESMVLLQDNNHALPLSTGLSSSPSSGRWPTTPATSSAPTCRSATTPPRARSSPCSTASRPPCRTPTVTYAAGLRRQLHVGHRLRRRGRRRQRAPRRRSSSSASRRPTAARPRRARHRPARRPARARPGDRRHRQAVRGRAHERAPADDPVAGRQRAGRCSRPGSRAPRAATPSPTSCSARSTRAASCR